MIRTWHKEWQISQNWVASLSVSQNFWGLSLVLFVDRDKYDKTWELDLTGRIGPVSFSIATSDAFPF
jgi:hypothetical protein